MYEFTRKKFCLGKIFLVLFFTTPRAFGICSSADQGHCIAEFGKIERMSGLTKSQHESLGLPEGDEKKRDPTKDFQLIEKLGEG